MKKIIALLSILFVFNLVSAQASQDYIELIKTNLQAEKKALIIQNMKFSEDESKVFWLVYAEYDGEMTKLIERRINNIKRFAEHYEDLSDDVIDEILKESMSIVEDGIALDKKYYSKLKEVLPTRRAAKIIQIINQIEVLIDFQITSRTPLIDSMPAEMKDSEKEPIDKKL